MIVLGTVLLNATTARLFAKLSGVFLESSDGIIMIGASNFARLIADYLQENGRRVVLIDNNAENVERAKLLGLEAMEGNVYSDELLEDVELNDIGYLLALTGNPALNEYAIKKFTPIFGENGAFRIVSTDEMTEGSQKPKSHLFTHKDDYINLSEVVRDYPFVNEVTINSQQHYNQLLKEINDEQHAIPLFLKDNTGFIHIISSLDNSFEIEKGNVLMYIGKKIV
jgi:D-arabinose 1-dehydrogenase-like Zn-dependent alcohol dehydrogenase